MYEFETSNPQGERVKFLASSWTTALHVCQTEYEGATVRLAAPATGVKVTYDLLRALLVVRYGDDAQPAVVEFLRRELKYRRREGVYGLSLRWTPSDEAALAHWLDLYPVIDLHNVEGELAEPGTPAYWKALATADLLSGGGWSPVQLWTRLRDIKASRHVWLGRLSKDQDNVTALAWVNFLDLQIAYMLAMYEAQDGDVHLRLKGLHRRYEVFVDGQWRRVWRVNEQTARCDNGTPQGMLVYPEQIQARRLLVNPDQPQDNGALLVYQGGLVQPEVKLPEQKPVPGLISLVDLLGEFGGDPLQALSELQEV